MLAVAALALAVWPSPPRVRARNSAPPSVQLAADDEDNGEENELQPPHQHGHQHQAGVINNAANKGTVKQGYDPHRIQRFWSHYHGGRTESKSHGAHFGPKVKEAR